MHPVRPVVKRKPTNRGMSAMEKMHIASDMQSGMTRKEVAFKYNITTSFAHQIFCEFLEYRIHWKSDNT
jgi:hypothetical protein